MLKEYIMKQTINGGYYRVYLRKNTKRKTLLVHRILALVFIPNIDNKPCINHIDGNKLNNSLTNLEWVTYGENQKHAYRIGLITRENIEQRNEKNQ